MSVCLGSARVCALRVVRLDADCAIVKGDNNAVSSTAIVRLQASPEYDTGDEFIQKNGCGDICLYVKNLDKLKRMNLTLELCTRDMEMIELLTGASLYTDALGEVIGVSRRGIGEPDPDPVSLELWTKAIPSGQSGACAAVGAASWWRWVYPRATFTLGDVTHENGIGLVTLAGFADPNPFWTNGPFNDWPAEELLDPESPEHFILDSVGPPATQCGYISVPLGS